MSTVEATSPSATPSDTGRFSPLVDSLNEAMRDEVFPGATVALFTREGAVFSRAVGRQGVESGFEAPVTRGTVYDIGAVTQLVGTVPLLMRYVAEGRIRLEDRVSRYVPHFGMLGKSPTTVGDLLSHRAGLPPAPPFFEELAAAHTGARLGVMTSRGAREFVYNAINRSELKYPVRSRESRSDLGIILVGAIIEMLSGMSLERAIIKDLFAPLELRTTSFIDLQLVKRRTLRPVVSLIAPTVRCPWRGKLLCGEVQEDNAWAMGGIAAHAGLFSAVDDVARVGSALLAGYAGRSTFFPADVVRLFFRGPQVGAPSLYRFGCEAPNEENGLSLSPAAVGMQSQTGCSVWLEPERGFGVAILSNHIHIAAPSARKLRQFRQKFHTLVSELVGA